ncbi:MAG: hypothetical protein WBX25_18775, partial [Rhodomicrobium sp.]
MVVSWRDILEKAAANPSGEPIKGPARGLKNALGGGYGSPWAAPRADDASSRDALARELQRVSGIHSRPQREASRAAASLARRNIAYVVAPPAPELEPRATPLVRANSWRNVVAVLFSFAVIGSTAQAFFHRGNGSVRDISELAAEPDFPNVRTAASSAGLAVAEWRPEAEPSFEFKSEPRGQKPLRNPTVPSMQHGLDSTSDGEAQSPLAPAAKPLLAGLNQVTE